MKGKIDNAGFLDILRGSIWTYAGCPFTAGRAASPANCGDWCSLFGEPEYAEGCIKGLTTTLTVCKKTWHFTNFNDFRKGAIK